MAALLAAGAWGADYVVERAPYSDATVELKWDSGTVSMYLYQTVGENLWLGNDFDIATISTYSHLRTVRLNASANPGPWNGARLGVYAFAGGAPGSLLWGPTLVVGTKEGWNDFNIGWTLPKGVTSFLAAVEQYYDYPNNDSIAVDDVRTPTGHTWIYFYTFWRKFNSPSGYSNVMVRVVMDDEHPHAVVPMSLGRVKALYH